MRQRHDDGADETCQLEEEATLFRKERTQQPFSLAQNVRVVCRSATRIVMKESGREWKREGERDDGGNHEVRS